MIIASTSFSLFVILKQVSEKYKFSEKQFLFCRRKAPAAPKEKEPRRKRKAKKEEQLTLSDDSDDDPEEDPESDVRLVLNFYLIKKWVLV